MLAGHDLAIRNLIGIDVPKKKRPAILPLHIELLIEIAIVNLSLPTDADRVATHQSIDGCGIKRVYQQFHILVELAIVPQISGKTRDRKICNRVEFVENDSEMRGQLAFVISFQFPL